MFRPICLTLVASMALYAVTLKKEGERKKAPDFELKDSEGKVVHLTDLVGKVVLLDFWATWCGPCKASMPWMNELAGTYRSEGLEVIGVSMDEDGWQVVRPFIEKMGVNYPILMGNKRVAYLYGDVSR